MLPLERAFKALPWSLGAGAGCSSPASTSSGTTRYTVVVFAPGMFSISSSMLKCPSTANAARAMFLPHLGSVEAPLADYLTQTVERTLDSSLVQLGGIPDGPHEQA